MDDKQAIEEAHFAPVFGLATSISMPAWMLRPVNAAPHPANPDAFTGGPAKCGSGKRARRRRKHTGKKLTRRERNQTHERSPR